MRKKRTLELTWIFNSSPICPHNFLSIHCHYTSYLTCHIISHIYAPILLIFYPFLKTYRQHSLQANTLTRSGGDVITVHVIRIEQVQTGSDLFHHVKHSHVTYNENRIWLTLRRLLSRAVRLWQCVNSQLNLSEGSNLWIWLSLHKHTITSNRQHCTSEDNSLPVSVLLCSWICNSSFCVITVSTVQ